MRFHGMLDNSIWDHELPKMEFPGIPDDSIWGMKFSQKSTPDEVQLIHSSRNWSKLGSMKFQIIHIPIMNSGEFRIIRFNLIWTPHPQHEVLGNSR